MSPGPKKVAQSRGFLAQNYLKVSIFDGMPCCGSDWKVLVIRMTFDGSNRGSRIVKRQVILEVGQLKGLVRS